MSAMLENRYEVITAADRPITTGDGIPIWRPSVFQNRSSFIWALDWAVTNGRISKTCRRMSMHTWLRRRVYPPCKFEVLSVEWNFPPNRRNITTLWIFSAVPTLRLFLDPTPRSNRWTDFHALWLKRRVFAQGWSFWMKQLSRKMAPKDTMNLYRKTYICISSILKATAKTAIS